MGMSKRIASIQGAQKWNDVERAAQAGAQRHASTKLYPYFLAYKAEALIQQGKLKDAAQPT